MSMEALDTHNFTYSFPPVFGFSGIFPCLVLESEAQLVHCRLARVVRRWAAKWQSNAAGRERASPSYCPAEPKAQLEERSGDFCERHDLLGP